MVLWKKEFLPPKISALLGFRRMPGQLGFISGLFLVLFLAIVLCANLQVESFQASSLYLEDALAASNLASAVIDLEEYGISHAVKIADPLSAYRLYCDAVKGNLGLNDHWEGSNQALISGPVTVENYIVYNVQGDRVTVHSVDNTGQVYSRQGQRGAVTAPNGRVVEYTGVYSEISFQVKGCFGMEIRAHKGKLVDVVGAAENEH